MMGGKPRRQIRILGSPPQMNLHNPCKRDARWRWRKLGPLGTVLVMAIPVALMGWVCRHFLEAIAIGVLFSSYFDRHHPAFNVSAIKGLFVLF
jgi:hypothetical protein